MTTVRYRVKGSARSGNYAHAGRPGKVGGSAPKGSAILASVDPGYQPAKYTKLKDMPSYKHFLANDYTQQANGKRLRTPDNSDMQLDDIAHDQGFDGLPHVVNQEEFDTYVAAGEVPMYRGLLDTQVAAAKMGDVAASDKTGAQMAEQFRSGTLHNGLGGYGNGTYTTSSKTLALGYARESQEKPVTGAVLAMTIRKEAKVASITKFDMKTPPENAPAGVEEAYYDIGRMAAMAGYDVLKITANYRANAQSGFSAEKSVYYIVLNRTAVRVLDRNLTGDKQ